MDPSHAQAMQAMLAFAQDASYMHHVAPEAWAGQRQNATDYGGYGSSYMQPQQQHYHAAAVAAAAAAGGGGSGLDAAAASTSNPAAAGPASLQPVQPAKQEQLSYAAIREALAVNQAADGAADDAMRAVTASQQMMQSLLHPMATNAMGNAAPMDDDATGSSLNPGRSRRPRHSGYMDHQGAAHLLAVAHSHSVYGGRPNKGLRHFSMKVCEKVESKGTTSYNEVADELVAELKDGTMDDGICYDEKNIRRRVYDAINVLMALDIIAKEKKAIIWRGFPTNRSAAQQVARVQAEQLAAMAEVSRKAQYLADLVEQQKALRHLLDRNSSQPEGTSNGTALHLPFILVQSKPDATVEVQISPDMKDVQFNFFNYPFEIHDDALVLRKMLEHDNMQKLAAAAAAAVAQAHGAPAAAAAAAAQAQQHHLEQSQQQPLQAAVVKQEQEQVQSAVQLEGQQQDAADGATPMVE